MIPVSLTADSTAFPGACHFCSFQDLPARETRNTGKLGSEPGSRTESQYINKKGQFVHTLRYPSGSPCPPGQRPPAGEDSVLVQMVQRAEAVGAQDRLDLCAFILGENELKPSPHIAKVLQMLMTSAPDT